MAAERAINMALRVVGLGDAQRDFKTLGESGARAFDKIGDSADKAAAATGQVGKGGAADGLKAVGKAGEEAARGAASASSAVEVAMGGMEGVASASTGARSALLAVGVGFGLVALAGLAYGAAVVRGAAELEEMNRAQEQFEARLRLTGNASGVAAQEIEALAEQTRRATDQSRENILSAANSLAAIPAIASEVFEEALPIAARYADALGIEVSEAAEKMGETLSAIAGGDLKEMEEKLAGIDPVARLAILALAETGQTAEAQKLYLKTLSDAAGDGPGGVGEAAQRLGESWTDMLARLEGTAGTASLVERALNGIASAMDNLDGRQLGTMMSLIPFVGTSFGNAVIANSPPPGANAAGGKANREAQAEADRNRQIGARAQLVQQNLSREVTLSGQTAKERARTADYDKARVQYLKAGLSVTEAEARASKFAADNAGARAGAAARGRRPRAARRARGSNEGEMATKALERAQEQADREADRARAAADRIAGANDDVIESYRLRAEEAQARLGKEGAALKQVEREQSIEQSARRISTDLIEKEIEAQRQAAVSKALEGAQRKANRKLVEEEVKRIREAAIASFDEGKARAEATAHIERQRAGIRRWAADVWDAEAAQEAFNKRLAEGRAVVEQVRTPIEQVAAEVKRLQALLAEGAIDADSFNRRMDQLAEDLVEAARKAGDAWEGFGSDVGRALSNIILNGGSAREILQQLIRLPLERLLFQEVETPIARFVDKATGRDHDTNVAKARAGLPNAPADLLAGNPLGDASTVAAPQVIQLGAAAQAAASALATIPGAAVGGVQGPLADLGATSDAAASGMGDVAPATAQFGNAVAQALAMLSGGGGAGGALGSIISLGAAALSGTGGGGGVLDPGFAPYGGTLGAIYHGGGAVVPGRAGRMLPSSAWIAAPRLHDGTLGLRSDEFTAILQRREEVLTGEEAGVMRRFLRGESPRRGDAGGGGGALHIHNHFAETMLRDPRRTAASVSAATQRGIARGHRKGLAR